MSTTEPPALPPDAGQPQEVCPKCGTAGCLEDAALDFSVAADLDRARTAPAVPAGASPEPVAAEPGADATEPAAGSEAAVARQLLAQAKAADDGYKVAAVRAAVYTFLHQHGRSAHPAFEVAIGLAVSLRKIIDDLGEEEARDGG